MASDDSVRLVEDLVAGYIDRLNRGERITPEQVHAEHPELAVEILDHLEAFIELPGAEDSISRRQLGDYTLRRQIGRGGMGVVYEAWQGSMDRPVALKVMPHAVAADSRAVARFVQEAQIAGKLHHPNIVRVFGMGVEEQVPYYAMELVEGETVAQIAARLRQAEPDAETPFGKRGSAGYFERIAEAFADVADGLQHAHSRKVVHRDIKPSNLILDTAASGAAGRLRILDFGLARLEGQEGLTISGDVVGTPQYMSPEQARRKKIAVDHRTDVYSLGATLYELLTLEPPFRGKDAAETLSQIIDQDPVAPARIDHRVPRDLETIVLKCLRKEAGDRYGTAEALGQDLRRFVRREPVEAKPEGRQQRWLRWLRRQRVRLSVTSLIVVLGLWIVLVSISRARSERARLEAGYDARVLDALACLYERKVSLDDVAGVVSGRNGARNCVRTEDFEDLDRSGTGHSLMEALGRLEAATRDVPGRPDAHYHLARAQLWLERPGAALAEVNRVLQIRPGLVPAIFLRHQISGGSSACLSEEEIAREAGRLLTPQEGAWVRAQACVANRRWRDAAHAFAELIHSGPAEPWVGFTLDVYIERGAACLRVRDYVTAQHDFAIARHISRAVEPALLLAKAYHLDGKVRLAEEIFHEVHHGAEPAERTRLALWIIAVKDSMGDFESALAWARELPESRVALRICIELLYRLDRTAEALALARRLTADDPGNADAHQLRGLCLLRTFAGGQARVDPSMLSELVQVASRGAELAAGDQLAAAIQSAAQGYWLQRKDAMKTNVLAVFQAAAAMIVTGTQEVAVAAEGTFGDVRRLGAEVNSAFFDTSPRISPDGLELFFSSGRPGGAGHMDLWVARRGTRDEPFSMAENVGSLNSVAGEWPESLSPDGTKLYFSSERFGSADLFVARRGGPGQPFDDTQELSVNTPGSFEGNAQLSPDGLELYFLSDRPGGAGGRDIWRSTRSALDAFWGEAANVSRLNAVESETYLSLSSDGLTLFWSYVDPSRPGGMGGRDIWYATRQNVSDPFVDASNLGAPVNTPQGEGAPGISRDWPAAGSELYFMRCGPGCGDADIYVAAWFPGRQFLRGDANGDSAVDVSDPVATLSALFLRGGALPCDDAADANDDGRIDLSDAVMTLGVLFLGEDPLPAPSGGNCGADPSDDQLGCESPGGCP